MVYNKRALLLFIMFLSMSVLMGTKTKLTSIMGHYGHHKMARINDIITMGKSGYNLGIDNNDSDII